MTLNVFQDFVKPESVRRRDRARRVRPSGRGALRKAGLPALPAPGRNCRPRMRRSGRAFLVKTRYERLSSMAFWSIWSAVVTTLLLDWKPRWVMIMLTISVAMSTLESSILYAWTVP